MHLNGLVSDLHAVDALDGLLGGLLRLVVHEAVATRLACHVAGDLARQDVSEQAEGVVEGLVVDVAVQVFHEDVARPALTQAGVKLAPHDPASAALDAGVVQRVERALGVGDAVEIDVAVAEGAARHAVAAHADGADRAHGVEDLVEHGLSDIGMQIAHVERGELRNTATSSHRLGCCWLQDEKVLSNCTGQVYIPCHEVLCFCLCLLGYAIFLTPQS
mmetsp:Transcript_69691/g.199741  ORF Transcript_69691/g.199741 Transcript_69691/m.199741 type:complete len:218 (-) Transcript_69691:37-690(-)